MKKFLLLLVCCFALLGLTSCKAKVVGTWKFAEMTVEVAGVSKTVKAGESFMGQAISEDYMVLVLEKDGTGTMTVFGVDAAQELTWEKDGDVVKITSDGETLEATLEDDYLVLSEDGSSIKFAKQK